MNKYLKFIIPVILILVIIFAAIKIFVRPSGHNIISRAPASNGSLQDFYNTARQLAQQPRGEQAGTTVTFLAVGDIMLSRNVAAKINQTKNIDLPFTNMADILKSTNFNFGNLESPVAAPGTKPIVGGNSLIFGAATSNLQALKDFNFGVINLTNNHAFDQGLSGLDYTRAALDNLSILHEGTGDNLDQAWQPAVMAANGIKICFIGASFSSLNDGGKATNDYVARIGDETSLQSSITQSKSLCDYTVVTMHAGVEYTRAPNQAQTTFARAAIEDGADMVIGAHPHWIQSIEKYNDKYIFYSLGNFVFDQEWSRDTKEGLTLKITLTKNPDVLQGQKSQTQLQSVELIPVILENYSTPRPATETETKSILNKIGQTSATLLP